MASMQTDLILDLWARLLEWWRGHHLEQREWERQQAAMHPDAPQPDYVDD